MGRRLTGSRTGRALLCFAVIGLLPVELDSRLGSAAPAMAETMTDERPAPVFGRPAKPSPVDIEAGRQIYFKKCVFCHGPEGAGDGPESQTHWPRPRNFNAGTFKIRHTASGELPTEQDLFLTVTNGLPGSAMPTFEGKLAEQERHQVVAFVMTKLVKDRDFQDAETEEFHVIDYGTPVPSSEESIKRGRNIFVNVGKCFECHGVDGHGDGNLTMKDEWGNPIVPADLYKCWNFRGNRRDPYNPRNIFREVSTGLNGTPMPSFAEILSIEARWDVANFVISLCPKQKIDMVQRRPVTRFVVRPRYINSALPTQPEDPAWQALEPQYVWLIQPAVLDTNRKFVQLLDNLWLKVLYNDKEISWFMEWDDRNKSSATPNALARKGNIREVAAYEDDPGFGDEVGMMFWNDEKSLLDVWQWESAGTVREYTARGALAQAISLEERSKHLVKVVYSDYKNGRWRVILTRELTVRKPKEAVQFEPAQPIQTDFFAWDGHNGDHGVNFPKWEARYKTILTKENNPD